MAIDEIDEGGHWIVVANDESATELLVEVGETAGEEPAPVGAAAVPEAIVDDEQWNDLVALVERSAQRRVVGEA